MKGLFCLLPVDALKCWRCSSDASTSAFCDDPFDPSIINEQVSFGIWWFLKFVLFLFVSYSNVDGLLLTATSHQVLNSLMDSSKLPDQFARKWNSWVSRFDSWTYKTLWKLRKSSDKLCSTVFLMKLPPTQLLPLFTLSNLHTSSTNTKSLTFTKERTLHEVNSITMKLKKYCNHK